MGKEKEMGENTRIKVCTVEDDGSYEDNFLTVDDVKVTYIQSADCVSHEDAVQEMEISTANNGTARFLILKTKRWAISDIGDLEVLIKDFCTRAGIKEEEKKE